MSAGSDSPGAAPAFSARVVLALVLTGVFAFCAYVVLSAYAPDLRQGGDGGSHALSSSATGYGGIFRLMRLTGQKAYISRFPKLRTKGFDGLLVLTPGRPLQAGDLTADIGDRLIVLPKWLTAPDPKHPGWVLAAGQIPPEALKTFASEQLGPLTVSRRAGRTEGLMLSGNLDGFPAAGLPIGPVQNLQTVSGPNLTPLLTDPSGGVVLAARQGSRTFVLSDPDLLNTQGLADLRTARVALLMLYNLHDPDAETWFDVTLNGFASSQSLIKLATEPPFLGLTLCLLAAAGLIGLQGWNRFGAAEPARRVFALGKTSLVENGAGMIRLAKREPRMALRYVRLSRERALKALGAADLPEEAQDAFLDRWAERVGAKDRVSALLVQAAGVKTTGELTPLAQRTRQWRREMTREPE